ncbi:serine/threonine protein kinase [Friedmanniella endophytica]|uniref:non-specific serine/threonine protein kinase n=1 Tax=Microlunatus kandeliicorticis TaxID=1759536 RepID=A0A7W3ITC9_9ACTN|nr:serine/threonine-protein kinase [Microlunatus kandeliicorticis]MBA8794891.1 serine/threonine protein kinase [Microlunatus kandeliicorticis]
MRTELMDAQGGATDTGRIGRYATRRVLGTGAFATVWLGRDDELDAWVAIKVLADNWAHNAEVRGRFVEEARTLRRISDARVIGVHDIGTLPDGRSYFVMDHADGGTLADRLGRLTRAEALGYAVEVAQAVQVLHDHGVLHRDLKPSNLLLAKRAGRTDRLMVADLGTAKALAEASGLTLSAGTPAYMAPEQAHGRWGLDQRADVYGLGAVTHALLTGHPPFPGERDLAAVAFRDPATRPEPVDGGGPLDELLASALAFDPADRPQDAQEYADALVRIAVAEAAGRIDDRPTQLIPRAVDPAPRTTASGTTSGTTRPPVPPPRRTDESAVSARTPWEAREEAAPVEPVRPSAPEPARARLSAGGLVSIALLVFVVVAVATWLLLAVF